MGPLLTRYGRRAALALLPLLSLSSCWPLSFRKPECVQARRMLPLAAPYTQYFTSLPACNVGLPLPVSASSSTGLTDSYSGGCLATQEVYDEQASSACEVVLRDQRNSFSYASLYGYSFATYVEQATDGPLLRLRDLSMVSATASPELTYRFADGQTQLSYRDANNSPQPFTPAPVVTELRNFGSGGRTYAQVWRLTNPLNAAQGRATAATAYYIDRDYGLIAFDLRDGTRWTLAR